MKKLFTACILIISSSIWGIDYHSTYWEYSPTLQLEKMTEFADAENPRTTLYDYGLNGLLRSITKPSGAVIHYEYDYKDRLKKEYASDRSFSHHYLYDLDDHLAKIDDGTCPALEVQNIYNKSNQKVQSLYPDNSYVTYEYENGNLRRLDRFDSSGKRLYTYLYNWNSSNQLKKIDLPNQLGAISYKYDHKGRLKSILSPYWSESIEKYNTDGNMLSCTIKDAIGEYRWIYTYDEQNRLIHESNTIDFDQHYTYDPLYNLTAINGANRKVDAYNQTLQTPEASYTYDANGNLATKSTKNSTIRFSYDALDRLQEAVINESETITYIHDANFRRLKKITSHHTYTYIYDGNNEVGCMDEEGNILELRILAHGIGAEIGAAAAIELQSEVYIPLHDHRGNVTTLVNLKSGQVAETHRYSAFGEFDSTGSRCPWRFYSKRYETELELTNFGKRLYSSDLAKWTTPDPLGFNDNSNRYVFVNNNPINFVDLYGLFSVSAFWQNVQNWFEAFSTQVGPEASVEAFDESVKDFFRAFMGPFLYWISDMEPESTCYGVTNGKKGEKVKITFINGILNSTDEIRTITEKLSMAHNGEQVYYIYRGSEGWTKDIMRVIICKLGFMSENAYQLALAWKQLVKDLGGTDSEGLIYHYAHSAGATETMRAKKYMSPEELRMIHVITFGPATIIPNEDFHGVTNYVSRRDGVCLIADPVAFISGLISEPSHIVFLGAHMGGIPLFDHVFQAYYDYLKDLFEKEG